MGQCFVLAGILDEFGDGTAIEEPYFYPHSRGVEEHIITEMTMPRLRPAIPAEEKALNAPSKFKINGPDLMDGGTCPASDVNYSVGSREGVVK